MRKTVERNSMGQMKDISKIKQTAARLAKEYFDEHDDVDVFDLVYIFETTLHHIGMMTMLKEGESK